MPISITTQDMHYGFDDRNIQWFKLGDFEHFVYAMLNVDEEKMIVDAILKFEPNKQIFTHRHLALTNTLVLQGEHHLYKPNGELKEIRSVGNYTSSPADKEPHSEGGGNEGAVVLYNIRTEQDTIFEILDGDLSIVGTLGMQDFMGVLKEQKNA